MGRGRLSKSPVNKSVGDPGKIDGQPECTVEARRVVLDVGDHPPDVLRSESPSSPSAGIHKQGGGCWQKRVKCVTVQIKQERLT